MIKCCRAAAQEHVFEYRALAELVWNMNAEKKLPWFHFIQDFHRLRLISVYKIQMEHCTLVCINKRQDKKHRVLALRWVSALSKMFIIYNHTHTQNSILWNTLWENRYKTESMICTILFIL